MVFTSSDYIFTGGSLRLGIGEIDVGSGLTATINSTLVNLNINGTGAASYTKTGSGTLILGGANTYTGDTSIHNGTLQLATGNDRLPTGTTVSLGQASSANLGTLDLNGRNQQIAGLNSTTGTNATASNNTVTSATAATLTLGGSGTYSFGDGTDANSGVITGAISIVKTGSGTQTLGDANTYTGTTTINGGTLALGASGSINSSSVITVESTGTYNVNAVSGYTVGATGNPVQTLRGTGTVTGAVTVGPNGTILAGDGSNAVGTLTVSSGLTISTGGTIGVRIDGAQESTGIAGSSSSGSNNNLLALSGTLTGGNNAIIAINGFGASFDPSKSYSYTIATGVDGSGLSIDSVTNPSQFTFANFSNSSGFNFSVTGDNISGGHVFLNFTPVPEPATVLGIAVAALGFGGFVRRKLRKPTDSTLAV